MKRIGFSSVIAALAVHFLCFDTHGGVTGLAAADLADITGAGQGVCTEYSYCSNQNPGEVQFEETPVGEPCADRTECSGKCLKVESNAKKNRICVGDCSSDCVNTLEHCTMVWHVHCERDLQQQCMCSLEDDEEDGVGVGNRSKC
jgi:hypothetical protein